MFVIDQIVHQVIAIISRRKDQECIRSVNHYFSDETLNRRDFIYHQKIKLEGIGVLLLKRLMEMDEKNPFVRYAYQAFDFDCKVTLQLAFTEVRFLDWQWLAQTPFRVENATGQRYMSICSKSISYREAANLPEQTILLVEGQQIITKSAEELLEKRKIQWIKKEAIIC